MNIKGVFAVTLLTACASASGPDGDPQIDGTYATAVSLGDNSCTGVTVQNAPTTVATTGATSFNLTHAGQVYSATLSSNKGFSTAAKTIVANGKTFTITITGTFHTNGFVADTRVVESSPAATCEYVVHWVGTK